MAWRRALGIVWAMLAVVASEAAKRGKHRQRPSLKKGIPERFWPVMTVLVVAIVAPVVVYFCYSVATDPATPVVARTMWKRARKKLRASLTSLPGSKPSRGARDHESDESDGGGGFDGVAAGSHRASQRKRRGSRRSRRERRRVTAFSDSSDSDGAVQLLSARGHRGRRDGGRRGQHT